jgi:hypothetical protein
MKQLEQMLEFAPKMEQKNIFKTIDTYLKGTAALYTGPDEFIPSDRNYGQHVIPCGDQTGIGGDVHETFRTDRYDNIYGGHTTIQLPEYGSLHIPWNE